MALSELLEAVERLSPDERRQLEARLSFGKQSESTRLDRQQQAIYDALTQVTRSRMPVAALVRDHKFRPKCEEIYDFLSDAVSRLREPQIQGLVKICFDCLAEQMRNRSLPIPVTMVTLLKHSDWLPVAVDRAFPGYHGANMLHRLVDRSA